MKRDPGATFVISDLGYYGTESNSTAKITLANLPNPALIRTRGTPLGDLKLTAFKPTPIATDDDCNVIDPFKSNPGLAVSGLINAFLYLSPQKLRLREATPADLALDTSYMSRIIATERDRRPAWPSVSPRLL